MIPLCLQTTIYLSPFSGCGPLAAQLDPWCWALLWPDCTCSEVLVQDFHRRVTWSQTYGQILVSTTCDDCLICARRATHFTLDGVLEESHSGGCCASSVGNGSNRPCNRSRAHGAFCGGCSSTRPHSMNAVVHMDANNAVDPS